MAVCCSVVSVYVKKHDFVTGGDTVNAKRGIWQMKLCRDYQWKTQWQCPECGPDKEHSFRLSYRDSKLLSLRTLMCKNHPTDRGWQTWKSSLGDKADLYSHEFLHSSRAGQIFSHRCGLTPKNPNSCRVIFTTDQETALLHELIVLPMEFLSSPEFPVGFYALGRLNKALAQYLLLTHPLEKRLWQQVPSEVYTDKINTSEVALLMISSKRHEKRLPPAEEDVQEEKEKIKKQFQEYGFEEGNITVVPYATWTDIQSATNELQGMPFTIIHYTGPIRDGKLWLHFSKDGNPEEMDIHSLLWWLLTKDIYVRFLFLNCVHGGELKPFILLSMDRQKIAEDLLNSSPYVANILVHRWSLESSVADALVESFYVALREDGLESYALFAARQHIYAVYSDDPHGYYGWAAPTLITRTPPIIEEIPPEDPGAVYEYVHDSIRDQQAKAVDQWKRYIKQAPKHMVYLYEALKLETIEQQFHLWLGELGTKGNPTAPEHMRNVRDKAERFIKEVLEELSARMLSRELSSEESVEKTFRELVEEL